jgi:hypothetical protein
MTSCEKTTAEKTRQADRKRRGFFMIGCKGLTVKNIDSV